MCTGATIAALMLSAAGTAATVQQGMQANKAQKSAAAEAKKAATLTSQREEEARNKAEARTPDLAAMLASNTLDAKSGGASTLLSGPQGVNPSSLLLGRNTLLGA